MNGTAGATGIAIAILTASMAACGPEGPSRTSFDRAAARNDVSDVLDRLHSSAARADEEAYFSLFGPDAVFFGTDASERWPADEFREYAHNRFEQGRGWTYTLRGGTRHIYFGPNGRVAWFDEVLDNENYGETLGTGVLRQMDGEWKIVQYNLTIPVPNELVNEVVRMIRELEEE